MYCSLKLKKKSNFLFSTPTCFSFFIHSLVHSLLRHSFSIHWSSILSIHWSSSLKLTLIAADLTIVNVAATDRQRHRHPPSASQAAAQLRPDRRHPIVATDRQRQYLFQHGPKPLISSDQPPINSFSLRPTAIRLRPTPPIGVLARRRCVCLWFLIFDIVCDQWFWLVWVEKKIGNLGFFFFFFFLLWTGGGWWWWRWVKIVAVAVVGVVNFFWKWDILFYCNSYIILLWYLYYFIVLKVKIDPLLQHMYR